MKKIVVNDTNVFIDLHAVGLLDQFFLLPCEVYTTDFVMLELLREGQKETVSSYQDAGLLHVATFDSKEVGEIMNLYTASKTKTNVSFTDCSVWYYAWKNNYVLLTGDRKLRNSAVSEGVEVRGILYIFDDLVGTGILSESQAAEKISLLRAINLRLPDTEIQKRLSLWLGE